MNDILLSPQERTACLARMHICHHKTRMQPPSQPDLDKCKTMKLCICSIGHTLLFGDQLTERLLDAIMWSGYVARVLYWCIYGYKANLVSCEDASGIIELHGIGQRQKSGHPNSPTIHNCQCFILNIIYS